MGKQLKKRKANLEARIKQYELAKKSSSKNSEGYTKPGSMNK